MSAWVGRAGDRPSASIRSKTVRSARPRAPTQKKGVYHNIMRYYKYKYKYKYKHKYNYNYNCNYSYSYNNNNNNYYY